MTRINRGLLVLAVLLASGAARGEAGESESVVPELRGLWVDIGLGWAWTQGNDVRVAQQSTSVGVEDFFTLELDADSRPLRAPWERDTMLVARAGFEGEVWGVDGQLWRLAPGAAADTAFAIERDGQPFESFQVWGTSFTNTTPGDYLFEAGNDLSLSSGRLMVTRSVGSAATVSFGLHVARLENDRTETLAVVVPSGRGFEIITSVSQSVLFTSTDYDGGVSVHTEFLGGLFEQALQIDTEFSSRAAVPVTEVQAALSIELTDNLSVGIEGLFSAWYDVPMALELSLAEGDSLWMERQKSLVFAQVGPTRLPDPSCAELTTLAHSYFGLLHSRVMSRPLATDGGTVRTRLCGASPGRACGRASWRSGRSARST